MGKITPSDDGKQFPLNINPTSKDNNITLLTKNRCVTKDIIINYNIPNYSKSYYTNYNVDSTINRESYSYDNTLYFYKFKWAGKTIQYTFNANILPLYQWYNQNYKLTWNIQGNDYIETYSLQPSQIFASGNTYYEEIIGGTTKASEYQGCQVYYTSSQESSYVYLGTIASNAKGTFNIDGDHLYNPSSFIAGRETFLTATNVNFSVYEANRGPNASYPSVPTFYIKTQMYAVDTDNFSNWSDVGIYIIPKYNQSGSSKCYLQIFNHQTTSDYYASEKQINSGEAIILMPNPDTSSDYKWYYKSATNPNNIYGFCKRFRLKWNNSNVCPYVIRIKYSNT